LKYDAMIVSQNTMLLDHLIDDVFPIFIPMSFSQGKSPCLRSHLNKKEKAQGGSLAKQHRRGRRRGRGSGKIS
jgi:hypothetical protein